MTGDTIVAARATRRIVVVGNGMAGARVAEELRRRQGRGELEVLVIGGEPHPAYNRILLSNVLAGSITARDTRLKPDGWWERQGIEVRSGIHVTGIDTDARQVSCDDGTVVGYDELVLATGSRSFIPPVAGAVHTDGTLVDGVAAFRTIGDCEQIMAAAVSGGRAVVLGAGLLGLEAARGLLMRGMDVTVVHPKGFPMERQLDAGAGAVLVRVLTELGMTMVLGRRAVAREDGAVVLDDGTRLPADLLVLSAGIRPDVAVASAAGIEVEQAVVVDDQLRTSAPNVYAVGECAQHRGEVYGLVQPGWEQAAVVAEHLAGQDRGVAYEGTANVTRLKAHDIDLASMGEIDADMHCSHSEVLTLADPTRGRYAKLVVRQDRVVGAVLLGNPDVVGTLTQLFDAQLPLPADRMSLLTGRGGNAAAEIVSPAGMPGSAVICRCNSVTKSALTGAWKQGARSVAAMATATRATTGCGGCSTAVQGICEWLRTADPQGPEEGSTAPIGAAGSIEEEGAA